ncbi:cephalosporin hydroxylase family protein [Alteromonas marina]|uniref:cephalosporin hydroxylase family protein n=1 Tax=unclassified Alteromonas TaxID=2614992 RepID=UPI0012E447DF|nr:CmcI family methyltransferase [Alteromonas sp. KUL150]GFD72789.1 hydroxylase [Tenacibaculum sp. KUL113]GFD86280.1 hydroxylase [Alteromonas sp. KUL150]
MKITIDTEEKTLSTQDGDATKTLPLYSKEAFETLSKYWVKVGWNQKYVYTFSWFGRPVIQLPEDMIRMQEVIYQLQPDVIVETGVAHGGSLVFYASLMQALDKGRVIGIDIEIRPHNRAAIEAHSLFHRIELVEGSSTDEKVVADIKSMVKEDETVLVILDSNHTYQHVLSELEAYAELVSVGSYIVATDGIMQDLSDVPRGGANWDTDNPTRAAADFVKRDDRFEIVQPEWPFNESELADNITHWPGAWIKRVK